MTHDEWESLCDGCGHCCLIKLQDEDDDAIYVTNVACRQLDLDTCRCKDYANREQEVEMCMALTIQNLAQMSWLPETCAYRCLSENRPLPDWHPLITGNRNAAVDEGISVQDYVFSEESIRPDDLEDHIVYRCD